MKMRKMVGTNCLLYSAAMVLDVDAEVLITEIGHDGSRLEWTNLGRPLGEINFHIQEIIDCCIRRGYTLTPIELYPVSVPDVYYDIDHCAIFDSWDAEKRFEDHIKNRVGILVGQGNNGLGHAAAWDGELVYDPNGVTYDISDFKIREAWLLARLI